MRALVVFESMYGNTRQITEAAANGLPTAARTDVTEVSQAPAQIPGDVDLLVADGPTHAFWMTLPGTRRDAAKNATGPLASGGTGIREWLATLATGSPRTDVAAFGTKVRRPLLRSAAQGARRQLPRRGFRTAEPARTFLVRCAQGPWYGDEEKRAGEWGAGLGLAPRQPSV